MIVPYSLQTPVSNIVQRSPGSSRVPLFMGMSSFWVVHVHKQNFCRVLVGLRDSMIGFRVRVREQLSGTLNWIYFLDLVRALLSCFVG